MTFTLAKTDNEILRQSTKGSSIHA